MVDIVLRNGHVIDPRQKVNRVMDVYIKDRKIVEVPEGATVKAEYQIDVQGCLVVPGLIDFHTHVYDKGTDSGITDAILPSMGVTTIVDGGSAGSANFEAFYRDVVVRSNIRIKSLINISPTGIITRKYPEVIDPELVDEAKTRMIADKYRHNIIGIKARASQNIVGNKGIMPIKAAVDLAEQLDCMTVVHATEPGMTTETLANTLRKGDVFCHAFHGRGNTIIGKDGKVLEEIKQARKRGVVFDVCNGWTNFANKTAIAAMAEGFLPDVISTDLGMSNAFRGTAFALPYIMSKYLTLGMKLVDVVKACTETPARLMSMDGQIGTLAPGAYADVTVLKLNNKQMVFNDYFNDTIAGSQVLIPQITIGDGMILFRQMDI